MSNVSYVRNSAKKNQSEKKQVVSQKNILTKRFNRGDKDRILDDYHRICDSETFNYKRFAYKEINYNDHLTDEKIANRLQRHNDMYTLAMISNALAPIENNDLTVGTYFEVLGSFLILNGFNPDFKMDTARLLDSVKEYTNKISDDPKFKFVSPVLKSFSEKAGLVSNELFDKAVEERLKNKDNNLDGFIMTPRQIACLRLNFAEQCYEDMRRDPKPGFSKEQHVDICKMHYNDALTHLDQIAKGSNVKKIDIAAEERKIVAMKMREDPSYCKYFGTTSDLYGAKPQKHSEITGEFKTFDSKSLLDELLEVRSPMLNVDLESMDDTALRSEEAAIRRRNEKSFVGKFSRLGDQVGYAVNYLNSDDCNLPKEKKAEVQGKINDIVHSFKKDLTQQCKDDNVSTKLVDLFQSHYDRASHCSRSDPDYEAYLAECHFVICRDQYGIGQYGVGPYGIGQHGISDRSHSSVNDRSHLSERLNKIFITKFKSGKSGSNVECDSIEQDLNDRLPVKHDTPRDIYTEACSQALSKMDAGELCKTLLHASTNMEQGFGERSNYIREFERVQDVQVQGAQDDLARTTKAAKKVAKTGKEQYPSNEVYTIGSGECQVNGGDRGYGE